MTDRLVAPWTHEQVVALNRFQRYAFVHPFTCPHPHPLQDRILIAAPDGWHCPVCPYTQNWAHALMLNEQSNPFPQAD